MFPSWRETLSYTATDVTVRLSKSMLREHPRCSCELYYPQFLLRWVTSRREEYSAFLSDILHIREKENKVVHDEVNRVFAKVNAEEDSSTVAGLANLDRRLCEQVCKWAVRVFPVVVCVWRGVCLVSGWRCASAVRAVGACIQWWNDLGG